MAGRRESAQKDVLCCLKKESRILSSLDSKQSRCTLCAQEFVNHMVQAVEEAGNQAVLIKDQVRQRPSKNGKYLSVSVHKVNVESGEQVYGIYEAIRSQCGDRLKFII